MYYIYILYSEASGTYYTGFSDNVERRVLEHNDSPHNTFTSKHRPWRIKAAFSVSEDLRIAMRAGKFIKKQKSRAFIEKICESEVFGLPMAQLVRAPKSRD